MLNIDKKTEGKTAIIEGIIVTIVMIIIAPLVPGVLDVTRPALAYGFLLFYLTVSLHHCSKAGFPERQGQ